ncbi:MAG: DMT family transporter [Pseudomonadota bacterium]
MGRGLVFGLMAAFCWGAHSVIVRYLTSGMSGLQIGAMRLLIAAATIFLMLKLMRATISINWRDRNFQLAVIFTVINYVFFHVGLQYTGAANAMVLENTAPIFVLLFLYVFAKAAVGWRQLTATGMTIIGVMLTVANDLELDGTRLTGDLLELAAGISWAGFLIASSRAMLASDSTQERLNFLLGVFLCAGVLMSPLILINPAVPSLNDSLFLILLGLVPTALAYYLWYEAAARISTLSATLMFALSVVFTFINAAIFLGETVSWLGALGAVLIVIAIMLISKDTHPDRQT